MGPDLDRFSDRIEGMVDCRLSWSEMAPDTVANPVDRLSPAVLTRTREYAGKSRSSADSNVQVQVFPAGQQSFETTMLSVCMARFNPVSAQFPQQSCPALADTPPRVVKKQTSRTRETNLYVWRYRFMVFSLYQLSKLYSFCPDWPKAACHGNTGFLSVVTIGIY